MSPEVDLTHLAPPSDPVKGSCAALVEEVKDLGKDFWVCQLKNLTGFHFGIPEVPKIKVLVSSGNVTPQYLKAVVWFGLGVESIRNQVNLSFGTFLIIRSDRDKNLIAIAKLE